MLELKKLLESLHKIKEDKLPKFKSHIANGLLNEHELNAYAVLHTSFVLYAGSLSDKQQRLYQFYLPALSAQLKTADVIQQAQQLNQEQVTQSIKLLEEKELIHHFLVDVLVFARLNGDLSDGFKQVLSAFCHGQSITDTEISEIIYVTDCILSIDNKKIPDVGVILKLINNDIWLEFLAKKLTSDNAIITGGIWIIDFDVSFFEKELTWSNCIIISKNKSKIKNINGSVSISNSHMELSLFELISTKILLDNIKFTGCYDEELTMSVFSITGSIDDSVLGCDFKTINARPFLFLDEQNHATIKNTNFINCGNKKLLGGCVRYKQGVKFNNIVFTDCVAKVGGAIFCYYMNNHDIVDSKFINCTSHSEENQHATFGSIYFETSGSRVFLNTYIDNNITIYKYDNCSDGGPLLLNSFIKGEIYYYTRYSDRYDYGLDNDSLSKMGLSNKKAKNREIRNVPQYSSFVCNDGK